MVFVAVSFEELGECEVSWMSESRVQEKGGKRERMFGDREAGSTGAAEGTGQVC